MEGLEGVLWARVFEFVAREEHLGHRVLRLREICRYWSHTIDDQMAVDLHLHFVPFHTRQKHALWSLVTRLRRIHLSLSMSYGEYSLLVIETLLLAVRAPLACTLHCHIYSIPATASQFHRQMALLDRVLRRYCKLFREIQLTLGFRVCGDTQQLTAMIYPDAPLTMYNVAFTRSCLWLCCRVLRRASFPASTQMTGADLELVIQECPMLEEVEITSAYVHDKEFRRLKAATLRHLEIPTMHLTPATVMFMLTHCVKLEQLKMVDLVVSHPLILGDRNLALKGLSVHATTYKALEYLQRVSPKLRNIEIRSSLHQYQVLQEYAVLQKATFRPTRWHPPFHSLYVGQICQLEHLAHCPELEEIVIEGLGWKFTDTHLTQLLEFLPNLRVLIGDHLRLVRFPEWLPMVHLERLELTECFNLVESTIAMVLRNALKLQSLVLKACPSLEHLHLVHEQLEQLELSKNYNLALVELDCPKLRKLVVVQCLLTANYSEEELD